MPKQNSLCFPCLEKVRTKFPVFPVFPVPWPPCACATFFKLLLKEIQYKELQTKRRAHLQWFIFFRSRVDISPVGGGGGIKLAAGFVMTWTLRETNIQSWCFDVRRSHRRMSWLKWPVTTPTPPPRPPISKSTNTGVGVFGHVSHYHNSWNLQADKQIQNCSGFWSIMFSRMSHCTGDKPLAHCTLLL